GLALDIQGARTTGRIAYTFSPAYDSSSNDFNFFHSLLGAVSYEATPWWRLTARDVLTRSDESSEADRLALRRGRETFLDNSFELESSYARDTFFTTQYYRLSTFFDEDEETFSHTIGGTVGLRIFTTNTASLGYEYLTNTTTRSDAHADSAVVGHRVYGAL